MKKKLLSLSIAMLMTVGAMAQWVQPAMQFVPFQTVDDFETSGTYFYLYNVDAKAFFCGGNAWGTQMSISANPYKIYFQKYLLEEETEEEWADFPHYILRDSVTRGDLLKWMTAFMDGGAAGYCDGLPADMNNNFQGDMWEIFENGDDAHSFQIAPSVYNTRMSDDELRMGVDLSVEGNTVVNPILEPWNEPYEGAYALNWALVDAASYENLAEDFALYNRAMQLQSLLEGLKADYSDDEIDFSFAEGVFANTASTMEELDSAMTNLNEGKVAADYQRYLEEIYIVLDGATEDDPRDGTSLLKNPDFEAGNIEGWNLTITTVTNKGFQGSSYSNGDVTISRFCELWRNGGPLGDGEISQTLPALPAGKYSFSVDAIAVNQNGANPCSGVELFARGGSIEVAQTIATGNNAPEHYEINFVSSGDGDVTIGVRTNSATANWVAVDNFELWFYGEFKGDPYQEILLDYVAQLEEKYSDLDGKFLNAEVKQALFDEIEKAKDVTEGFQEEKSLLEELAAAVDASIADYAKFYSAMEYADERRLEFEDTWPDLSDLIADLLEFGVEDLSEEGWNQMYEDGTADSELCNNARETVEQIIADYISANLKPGDFVTPLIKNPDFKNGFDSWSNTGARPAFGGKGGNGENTLGDIPVLESGNAEVFHNAFDMFQTIKNMPKGSFTLTCQAFQRNESRDWANDYFVGPEEGITAVLYANEFESKICNFAAGAQEYEVYHSTTEGWESDIYNEVVGGYLPNSMDGANFFFSLAPEVYQVKVNFTLAEAGHDITIGLKNAHTNSWVIFDNFNLVYNGDNAEAYADAINDLVANLQNALPEDAIASSAAQEKVDAAITSLLTALASGDVNKCVDAIKEGTDALAYAKASVEAYVAVEKAYNDLNDALIKWGETAHEDALLAADAALLEAENAMSTLSNTNEELAELVQKMNDCAKGLMPVIYDVDLLPEDFCSWDQPEAGAVKVGQAGCAYEIGVSTGMPYGDGNVYYLNFADLSNANRLTIVATEGKPRCLFNRIVDQGDVHVEVPRDADYWTVTDNGDGSATYVVDIARIVAEYGYCHLHAIKGADWVNTTVTSVKVGYGENDLPDAINTVKKPTTIKAAGIYTLSGAKVNSLQKGMNIIVSEDGKVSKRFIK